MPELPEVESFRRFFDAHALNQKIVQVQVTDERILENITQPDLKKALMHQKFISTHRHGKFLFCNYSSNKWLVIHFGMTGDFRAISDNDPIEKHDRVIISFDKHRVLTFNDQRLFGLISLTNSIPEFLKERRFGPDALEIKYEDFHTRITKKHKFIKAVLLDQSVIAGVGNLYADEALFQAKIHPKIMSNNLSESQTKLLYDQIQRIFHLAIDFGADYGKFPQDFFIHKREQGGKCPRCANVLDSIKITQRTTYFCPNCQLFK